jgi:hypothetical protein
MDYDFMVGLLVWIHSCPFADIDQKSSFWRQIPAALLLTTP